MFPCRSKQPTTTTTTTTTTTIIITTIIIITIFISPSSSQTPNPNQPPPPQSSSPLLTYSVDTPDHQSTIIPHPTNAPDNDYIHFYHDDEDHHGGNDTHSGGNGTHPDDHEHEHHGIHVASIKFEYVKQPLILSIFMIVVVLAKLGFHHANFLSGWMPESCLLIVLGVIVGAILHAASVDHSSFFYLHPDTFFLFLLPPCILEASYGLHDPVFFENLGTILFYAIIGTLINCFIIGPLLYGLAYIGAMGVLNITFIECLVFSSLIVAVDPVAVLAIFQEVGVNSVLYFLVFGESLLNDAVTVVLYNTITTLSLMGGDIPASEIGLAFTAFFVVSLGGLTIGLIFGLLSALITRLMMHIRVVEPLAILSMAYASYLMAELFHFSGIISMIGCGLIQMQYAFHNISNNSSVTIKYFSKMLSNACDSIIFMFLGVSLIRDNHQWHTGFVLWSVILCLVVRFIVTYGLTFIVNRTNRLRSIGNREQFIMAYGGLRGAVAFCLVVLLENKHAEHKDLLVTATLCVILFTVFVQGITIKPLVKILRIEGEEEKVMCLYQEINNHVTDHLLVFMEEVIGHYGHNSFQGWLDKMNDKYLKKILQRDPFTKDEIIMEVYQQIALQQHYESVYGMDMSSQLQLYRPELIEKLPTEPPSPDAVTSPSGTSMEDVVVRMLNTKRRRYLSAASTDIDEDQLPMAWGGGGGQYGVYNTVMSLPPHVARQLQAARLAKRSNSVGHGGDEKGVVAPSNTRSKWKQARNKFIRRMSGSPLDTPLITAPNSLQLRKMMIKAPNRDAFARRTDRNLKEADKGDLLNLLNEKQMRHNRFIKGQSTFVSNINTPMINRSRAESLDDVSSPEEGKAKLRRNTQDQLLLRKKVKTVDFEEPNSASTTTSGSHTAAVHYIPRYQQRRPTSTQAIITNVPPSAHHHLAAGYNPLTPSDRKRSSSGGDSSSGDRHSSHLGKSPLLLQYINEEQEGGVAGAGGGQDGAGGEESPLKVYNAEMEKLKMGKNGGGGGGGGGSGKESGSGIGGGAGKGGSGDGGEHGNDDGGGGGGDGVDVKMRSPLRRQDAGDKLFKRKSDEGRL